MVYVWLNQKDKLWYTTEPDNLQLLDLFGTNTLPTPYGHTTALELVLATLRTKQPERVFTFVKETPQVKNLFDPQHYETTEELLEVCILHVISDDGQFSFALNKKIERRLPDPRVLISGRLDRLLTKLALEERIICEERAVPNLNRLAPFYRLTAQGAAYLRERWNSL